MLPFYSPVVLDPLKKSAFLSTYVHGLTAILPFYPFLLTFALSYLICPLFDTMVHAYMLVTTLTFADVSSSWRIDFYIFFIFALA